MPRSGQQGGTDAGAIRRMSEAQRLELMHAVRDGRMTIELAQEEISSHSQNSSDAPPMLGEHIALDDLRDMGDWAQMDTFEWDETDITLSTDEGLCWLQSLGIVSQKYRAEDLSPTQKDAVDRLLTKLHEKHQPFQDPALTADALEKDEAIKENVQEVMTLLSMEEQKQASRRGSAAREDQFQTEHTPSDTKSKITPQQITDVTLRLSVAWGHALEAKKANKKLEQETASLLLMSRARLQAEIISLRRENDALRAQAEQSQVMRALTAEKQLTAQLQELLDQRDSEMVYLSHELTLKNDEVAVLRSARDLSTSWRDSRRPSRRASTQAPAVGSPHASPMKRQNSHGSHTSLLSRKERLNDLLDRHGVPAQGRKDMWEGATRAAINEEAREKRHRRLEVNDGSPLPSEFVI